MEKTKNLARSAIFASLVCISTFFIQIPVPATHGYIHPGDALVILCGIFLNPISAFLAGGIGSCLADLFGGYFIYIPATFLIKGLIAYACSMFFQTYKKHDTHSLIPVIICGIIDTLFVVIGYALFETILYGAKPALLSIPPNFIQGLSGLIISSILYQILSAVPDIRKL